MICYGLDNPIGLSITTINYERHTPFVNTSVISRNLFISVSEGESDVLRVTKPLTCFSQLGLTLLKLRTQLLLYLLLQRTIDIRNEICFKLTAAERTIVHICLSDFFVTLEASEMLARRHYGLNTQLKANWARVVFFFRMCSRCLNSFFTNS